MFSKSTIDQGGQSRKQESLKDKKKSRKSVSYNTEGEPNKNPKRNIDKELDDKKKELEALKKSLTSQKYKSKQSNYIEGDKKNSYLKESNNLLGTKSSNNNATKNDSKDKKGKGSNRGIDYEVQHNRQEDILFKIEKSTQNIEELKNSENKPKNGSKKGKKSKIYDENTLKQQTANNGTKVKSSYESTSKNSDSSVANDDKILDEEDKKNQQKEPIVNHIGKGDRVAFNTKTIPDSTYSKQIIPFDHENFEFVLNSYDKALFNNVSKKLLDQVLNSIKQVEAMSIGEGEDKTKSFMKWGAWICVLVTVIALLILSFTVGLVYLYILSGFLTVIFLIWCIMSGYSRGKTVMNKKERAKTIQTLLKVANKKLFEPKGTWMSIGEDCEWLEFIILRPSKELKRQMESNKFEEKRILQQRNLINKIGGEQGLKNMIKDCEDEIDNDLKNQDPDSSMAQLNQSIHEKKDKNKNRRQSRLLKSAVERLDAEKNAIKKSVRFMDVQESVLFESTLNMSSQDKRKNKMNKKRMERLEDRENQTLDDLRKAKRNLKDLKESRQSRKEDLLKNGDDEILRSALKRKSSFSNTLYEDNHDSDVSKKSKGWSKATLKKMGVHSPVSEEDESDAKSNDSLDRSKFTKKKIANENLSNSSDSDDDKKKNKKSKIDKKKTNDNNIKTSILAKNDFMTDNPYSNIILESQIENSLAPLNFKGSKNTSLIMDKSSRNSYKVIPNEKKTAVGQFLDKFENDHAMPDKRLSNKDIAVPSNRSVKVGSKRNLSSRLIEHPSNRDQSQLLVPSDRQINRIQKSERRNSIFVGTGLPLTIKETNNDGDSPSGTQEDSDNKKNVYSKNSKAKNSQRKIENESKQRNKEDSDSLDRDSSESSKKEIKNAYLEESNVGIGNLGNIDLSNIDEYPTRKFNKSTLEEL